MIRTALAVLVLLLAPTIACAQVGVRVHVNPQAGVNVGVNTISPLHLRRRTPVLDFFFPWRRGPRAFSVWEFKGHAVPMYRLVPPGEYRGQQQEYVPQSAPSGG